MPMQVEFWTKDDRKVGLLEFHGIPVERDGTKVLKNEERNVVAVDRPEHLTEEEVGRIEDELIAGDRTGETEHYNWWSVFA